MLAAYAKEGFAPFAAEWQHRHAYQGKPVKLVLPDGAAVKGKVAGVDASGALVLADGPRRARFLTGELSLRRGLSRQPTNRRHAWDAERGRIALSLDEPSSSSTSATPA